MHINTYSYVQICIYMYIVPARKHTPFTKETTVCTLINTYMRVVMRHTHTYVGCLTPWHMYKRACMYMHAYVLHRHVNRQYPGIHMHTYPRANKPPRIHINALYYINEFTKFSSIKSKNEQAPKFYIDNG